jgi:hypothetical protein
MRKQPRTLDSSSTRSMRFAQMMFCFMVSQPDSHGEQCRAKTKRRQSLRPPSRSILVACETLPFFEPLGFPPSNVAIHWQDFMASRG